MGFDVFVYLMSFPVKTYNLKSIFHGKFFFWSTDSNYVFFTFDFKKFKSMYRYPIYGHISWLYIIQVSLMIIQTTNDMWDTIFYF